METFLLQNGIFVALALGILAILTAVILALKVKGMDPGTAIMREIAGAVEEGAKAYLSRQIKTISVIAVVIFILILVSKGYILGWQSGGATAIGFVIGACCSLLAGFIGMRVAVIANVRTAQAATIGAQRALRVAFNGGAVTGLLVVGLALLSVGGFYLAANAYFGVQKDALDALVGLALGASLISVFARLGGGIYTKAADVGRLGIDTAAETREDRDQARAQRQADQRVECVFLHAEVGVRGEIKAADAEQRQADHKQARDRAPVEGHAQGALGADRRGLRRAHVGDDRHAHADEAGQQRAARADDEADGGRTAGLPAQDVALGNENEDEDHHGDDADGLDLAGEIGLRAFFNRPGDFAHDGRAGIHSLHFQGENDGGQDGQDAQRECDENAVLKKECFHGGD
jgi:hypothetical protein